MTNTGAGGRTVSRQELHRTVAGDAERIQTTTPQPREFTEHPAFSDVHDKVLEVCRNILQINQIEPDSRLLDYGLDSLRATDLVVALEETFNLAISDEDASKLVTIAMISNHLITKLALPEQDS